MSSSELFWRRRARLVVWRWNVACLLRIFLPLAVVASAAIAAGLLITRRAGWSPSNLWFAYGLLLAFGLAVSCWGARRRFYDTSDALVRLEGVHQLRNRLSAAAAGVGGWPAPLPRVTDGWGWRWHAIGLPLLGSAAVLAFAAFVPIVDQKQMAGRAEPPASWTQLEQWIEALKKEDVVEKEALNDIEEHLDQLRKQPEESWYSHSSLEASDNIRQQTEQSLRTLERDLEAAGNVLSSAEELGTMNPALSAQLEKRFDEALKGLEFGTLPLNKELLSRLKGLDLSKVRQLSPGELAALKKCLRARSDACKLCLGKSGGNGDTLAMVTDDGDLEAQAGISRGGGPGEERYSEQPTELGTERIEAVANDDLSRAALGDVLSLEQGKHEVDPANYGGPVFGGAAHSPGAGGEAVWKNTLTPKERQVLQRFFK